MFVQRLSHTSYPEECSDTTELSASIWLCDTTEYKIISIESHNSGSLLLKTFDHDLNDEEIKDEIGEFVTGSYCPVCKSWWDGTNTGPDKYSLEPTYVHES